MDNTYGLRSALLETSKQDRLAHHCRAMTHALLQSPAYLKDVSFKCTDGAYVPAHKFILGVQCECASLPTIDGT
jgi:hypothetical protein